MSSAERVAVTPVKRTGGRAGMEASAPKLLKTIDDRAQFRYVEEVTSQMMSDLVLAKSLAEMLRDGTYAKMLHSGGTGGRGEGRVLPPSA